MQYQIIREHRISVNHINQRPIGFKGDTLNDYIQYAAIMNQYANEDEAYHVNNEEGDIIYGNTFISLTENLPPLLCFKGSGYIERLQKDKLTDDGIRLLKESCTKDGETTMSMLEWKEVSLSLYG